MWRNCTDMQANLRLQFPGLQVLLAALPLLLLLDHTFSQRVNRDWHSTPEHMKAIDDLDVNPGCSVAVDETERYQEIDHLGANIQKMKRMRKNYLEMQETCECMLDWNKWNVRNLSAGLYPANVTEINCTAASCTNCRRPYVCAPHNYEIKVLATKESAEPVDNDVPQMLQSGWKFVKIPISIGCKCIQARD